MEILLVWGRCTATARPLQKVDFKRSPLVHQTEMVGVAFIC